MFPSLQLQIRLAGIVAGIAGAIGGAVWIYDLEDRADGDSLRFGLWHNPFMQLPPFNEPFQDLAMWILLGCSTMAGIGGFCLLFPTAIGRRLVVWQARVSVIINAVMVACIGALIVNFYDHPTALNNTPLALSLRIGSIAVELGLWVFLTSRNVKDFFATPQDQKVRGFVVVPLRGAHTPGSA